MSILGHQHNQIIAYSFSYPKHIFRCEFTGDSQERPREGTIVQIDNYTKIAVKNRHEKGHTFKT